MRYLSNSIFFARGLSFQIWQSVQITNIWPIKVCFLNKIKFCSLKLGYLKIICLISFVDFACWSIHYGSWPCHDLLPHKYSYNTSILIITFHGILAFQHLHASLRCCRIVLALFCLIPSGIMSRISCMTAARNSKSKWLSTRCLVTVLATPLECLPSNCLARRLPSHLSSNGTIPRKKNSHTRHPGAQKPQPGPLPTAPW